MFGFTFVGARFMMEAENYVQCQNSIVWLAVAIIPSPTLDVQNSVGITATKWSFYDEDIALSDFNSTAALQHPPINRVALKRPPKLLQHPLKSL